MRTDLDPRRVLFGALFCIASLAVDAKAAELQVLAGGSIMGPLKTLAAGFEKASGQRVVVRYGTTPELIAAATSDAPFDVGVVPHEVLDDAAARLRFATDPPIPIARVGLGVAVRAGATKPDVSTPDALRRTLLAAASIATVPASAAGAQVRRAFDRLGVTDAVQPKIRALPSTTALVGAVANGEAELGVFLLSVLVAPGIEIVGPFPAEVQQEVSFVASPAAHASQSDAARAFIGWLRTTEAATVLRERGMTVD